MNLSKIIVSQTGLGVALSVVMAGSAVHAEGLSDLERSFVRDRAGCFDVAYRFFDPAVSESDMIASAKEFIDLEWVSETEAVLQHVSIGPDPDNPEGAADEVAIHWREEWGRSAQKLWDYQGDLQWSKGERSANDNELVYAVFQIDGSLRAQYPGAIKPSSEGKVVFKASALAPLPRRETKANRPADKKYDIMDRIMTIVLEPQGSYEELLLAKKLKKGERIGDEVGHTTFKRIADSECAQAAELWKSQKPFWQRVKQEWNKAYDSGSSVRLKGYRQIGTLIEMAYASTKDPAVLDQIENVIKGSIIVSP